jgi:hypothetical protein
MVPRIPLLADYLDLISPISDYFDHFLQPFFVSAFLMLVWVTFKPIPYGKTYTRGSSIFRVEVTDRLAVILMYLPGLIVFTYAQFYFPNGDILAIPALLYIGHLVHRSMIYPWFRRVQSKPWPLESALYFWITNFFVSTVAVRGIIFGGVRWPIALQLLLAVGFIACAIGCGMHDYKLCGLRRVGDSGYQVPHGLLFKWVSGPHYLLELLQWGCYIWFFPIGFLLATFGMWLVVNITGRAESNHDAYVKKLFRNKYPEDRTPYIPFVMQSRWLL